MKPELGMRVRPAKEGTNKWDGVIVSISPPDDEDHGIVGVWLENRLRYGDDNCEHYAYSSDEQLGKILKQL